MKNTLQTVWCQWNDIQIPSGFKLFSNFADLKNPAITSQISFYIPEYMGGTSSLKLIQEMPNLQYVQLLTAGYETALPYLPSDVALANARGVHDKSTAELALGLTLASRIGIIDYYEAKNQASWLTETRNSIIDSEVAIIGFGSIGQEIAKVFSQFTRNITGYTGSGSAGTLNIAELDANLSHYDIVIIVTPLTDETRGLFNAHRISLMKPGALLVNMARGPVVVTSDLITALNEDRIFAVLDVTDPEPLPENHPLWKAKNLLISPHVGGNSTAFPRRAKKFISDQLTKLSNGQLIDNLIIKP